LDCIGKPNANQLPSPVPEAKLDAIAGPRISGQRHDEIKISGSDGYTGVASSMALPASILASVEIV
jgi:hypothetical protein